jgi:GT2 family glycosyltransferase/glycosyltransferase involved in cell wall biosynthesis
MPFRPCSPTRVFFTTAPMKIMCVTINYNGSASTVQLLRSLERQIDTDFGVVVVDNASSPDDRGRLHAFATSSSLRLEIIDSGENLGFSGGNNLAIRAAGAASPDWIVVLNNDTEVDSDFIARVREELSDRDGIVGLPLLESETLVRAGRRRWLALTMFPHPAPDGAADTYAVGGGMAMHRRAIARIGPLDEAYFLYFEDADYTERARRAGESVGFASGPVIRHASSSSTRKLGDPLLARYHARNAIRFNRKHGPWWVQFALGPWILTIVAKSLVRLVIGPDRRRARGVLAGIADALRGRWGLIDERVRIGIECESLEGPTWGMGREVAELLGSLSEYEGARSRFHISLYSNGPLPGQVAYDPGLCVNRPVGRRSASRRRGHRSFSLYYFLLLPLALLRDRPSAVYFPNHMLPVGAARSSLVMINADIFQEVGDRLLPYRQRVLYRLFSLGWAKARATRIMTVSDASAEQLAAHGVERERIVVNPHGVDPPRDGDVLDPPPTFLWVGQAFPRRHLREVLEAFEGLARGHDDMTFRVIGPDRYPTPVLEDAVARVNVTLARPAVQWDEYVDEEELRAAYRSSTTIVYVSATEGFGLPPLEALTYGTPAVLADTPVNRELYGPHAFYVPVPITVAGIAAAMQRSRHDTAARERIRAAGPSITRRYTWAAHADRFMRVMFDLASR